MIRALAAIAGCIALIASPNPARAQSVQLEAKLSESWPMGLRVVSVPRAHVMFGVPLGEHVVVLGGIGGGYGELSTAYSTWSETSLTFPVEVELTLQAPEAGQATPAFRLGAAYTLHRGTNRQEGNETTWTGRSVELLATVGVQYLATESFGVVVDTGLRYAHTSRAYQAETSGLGGLGGLVGLSSGDSESEQSGLDVLGRIGIVLRL